MAGDHVQGERVLGFAFVPPERTASAADDRLLVEGDDDAHRPPDRTVPTAPDRAPLDERLPHQRLPEGTVLPAARVRRCLPTAMAGLLADRDARWSGAFDLVHDSVRGAGHELWISGGATRELVSGRGPEAVRDLDLAGTAPAGRFTELARQGLSRDGRTYECPVTVSPDSLVCTVEAPDRSSPDLMEYRGLGVGGFGFPATGSDIVADGLQRDFTVNSLLYDPRRHLVIDSTGHGLDHVRRKKLRLMAVETPQAPLVHAALVLRALKFLLRWLPEDRVDRAGLDDWTDRLPADLADRVGAQGDEAWTEVSGLHAECVADVPADRQLDAVRLLGPAAEGLLRALLEERG
ncbi:hypothetical protein ACWCP6_24500 [Streptomyces sp. NPDC002004]